MSIIKLSNHKHIFYYSKVFPSSLPVTYNVAVSMFLHHGSKKQHTPHNQKAIIVLHCAPAS